MSFTNIDVDAIKVDNKVVLKDGHGVLIKLVQGNTKPVTFQTPLMSLAWNVQVSITHAALIVSVSTVFFL